MILTMAVLVLMMKYKVMIKKVSIQYCIFVYGLIASILGPLPSRIHCMALLTDPSALFPLSKSLVPASFK